MYIGYMCKNEGSPVGNYLPAQTAVAYMLKLFHKMQKGILTAQNTYEAFVHVNVWHYFGKIYFLTLPALSPTVHKAVVTT